VVSRDRSHMAAIGRAGGQARGRNRALQAARAAAAHAEAAASRTTRPMDAAASPAE
jgi:hypothetical protein